MRLLVVDDDPLAGEMTGAILEDAGYTIVLAADAMDAMGQLEQNTAIAAIVSDMHMPLIDGIELYRALREQGVGLPFILLTGDDPRELAAQEPGLDACLMKDADMEVALREAVAEALGC